MDAHEISSIMAAKNLLGDPAFDALKIVTKEIPCTDTCPLGLYDPDTAIITLPPDAQPSVLLHELGHRYGHYYYNDLSEAYAEKFRKKYEQGKALLYFGGDLGRLPEFSRLFEEGERGAVEIGLFNALLPDEVMQIKTGLCAYGCGCGEPLPKVYYGYSDVPFIRVEFTQGVDWLTIIGAVLAGTVVVTVGTIGYAVYKVSKELPWVVPTALFGTGLFLLLRAMVREAKKKVLA